LAYYKQTTEQSTFSCSGLSDSSWNITAITHTHTCTVLVMYSSKHEFPLK